ncbi:MAG TPA: hypothetical protein VH595_01250, partial [Verrucomicrobiae bacterium]|nr:hypothetical protein [Verrucomicrobiae bacterium]
MLLIDRLSTSVHVSSESEVLANFRSKRSVAHFGHKTKFRNTKDDFRIMTRPVAVGRHTGILLGHSRRIFCLNGAPGVGRLILAPGHRINSLFPSRQRHDSFACGDIEMKLFSELGLSA